MGTIVQQLIALKDETIAQHSARFFKMGKGEYAQGDIFLGIRVPKVREVVRKNKKASLEEISELFASKYHEARLCAALLCVERYKNASKETYEFYMQHMDALNNWDLIDTSAPHIIGKYLLDKEKTLLYELAKSDNMWRRRIAILSTFTFIREGSFEDTLKIAQILLADKEDLIHKAVGWMLREVGNRDMQTLESFLKPHYKQMPRTMLRYSIEKFEKPLYKAYLKGEV